MSSFLNPNYFDAILNLISGGGTTLATFWGMFWQAFYAVVGCVIGAAVLGNYGALIGTVLGAWLGFRSVNPYHSLMNQLRGLNERQRHHLTEEVRRTVGSSTVESLLRYAVNGSGRQMVFDIIRRFLNSNNGPQQQPDVNPGLFSRIFS